MKILFVTDYFPPETNAAATRVFERARLWVELGHEVTVVTSAPNFPQGVLYPGYENRWMQKEERNGVRVVRVKTFVHPNRGRLLRILDQLSFLPMAFLVSLRVARPQVIVATSPTLFAALAAALGARVRRLPFVLEIGDLASASISAVGVMRKGVLLRGVEWLERLLYRRANGVVVQTKNMARIVVGAGVPAEQVHEVSNGVNLKRFAGAMRKLTDGKKPFVVGYVGTMGMSHGLRHVIAAAHLLGSDPGIRLEFVGDGAERADLQQQARDLGLRNVVFSGPVPYERIPEVWASLDLALVSLRDHPTFQTVVPSKIFEAMACGVPILIAAPPGEATDLVARHDVGTVVPPENATVLAEAIRQLSDSPATLQRQSAACARVVQQFDRKRLAQEYLDVLARLPGVTTR